MILPHQVSVCSLGGGRLGPMHQYATEGLVHGWGSRCLTHVGRSMASRWGEGQWPNSLEGLDMVICVRDIYIYIVCIYIYTHILYIYTHYHIIYTHILCICIMFQVCWPTSPPPMVCVGMHFSLFHPPMCLVGMCGSGSASVNSRRGVLTASSSRSSRSNDNSSHSSGMPPNPWGWGAGRPWTGSYKYLSIAFVYVFDVFVLILSTG